MIVVVMLDRSGKEVKTLLPVDGRMVDESGNDLTATCNASRTREREATPTERMIFNSLKVPPAHFLRYA